MEVGNWPGAQYVVIIAHKKTEIDTPAFREFLARAVEVVRGRSATSTGGIEGNMPWKKNGERWHLGEKGFPAGRGVKWDRTLLPKLIKLLREIDPGLEWKWDVRDAITVRPKGSPRFWARIKTKEADALEIWLIGRRGQTTLSQFEDFGRNAKIENDRADGSEVLKLWMVTGNHLPPGELKPLLTEHLKAFKKAYSSEKATKEAS